MAISKEDILGGEVELVLFVPAYQCGLDLRSRAQAPRGSSRARAVSWYVRTLAGLVGCDQASCNPS